MIGHSQSCKVTDFGLGQKSVKVQGLASDFMVEFTENGSRQKSVKELVIWNAIDCRKEPRVEICKFLRKVVGLVK
jgi:hypothetical protein